MLSKDHWMISHAPIYSAPVDDAEPRQILVRVPPPTKRRWEDMLKERKITSQDAAINLIEWVVRQDPLVQAMIFNQVPPQDDLVDLVLKRLRERAAAGEKGGPDSYLIR